MSGLDIEVTRIADDATLIVLAGEADRLSAATFHNVVRAVLDEDVTSIVIDTTAVTFLDLSSLGVFVDAQRRLRSEDSLAIVCDGEIRRLFQITGLDHTLTLVSDREEALGAVR
jgi:anti-anti-sigma factor